MPVRRLTVDREENPDFYGFQSIPASSRGCVWTTQKFSTEYPCHVQLIRPRCVRVRLSPYGLVHDTSSRRGTRPRHRRALVRSCRTAAGVPHRAVRDRPLAPLSQRTRLSREYPGGQDRGGNLARSVDARSLVRQFRRRHFLARTQPCDAAARRDAARSGPSICGAGGDPGRIVTSRYFDSPGNRSRLLGRGAFRAGLGRASIGQRFAADAGYRSDRATLPSAAQRAVAGARPTTKTVILRCELLRASKDDSGASFEARRKCGSHLRMTLPPAPPALSASPAPAAWLRRRRPVAPA